MNPLSILLLITIVAIVAFCFGFANSMNFYYERAEKGTPFEAKGKIYRIVEVEISKPISEIKNNAE